MNETVVIEQEYKLLRVLKNNRFYEACRTNRTIIRDSLYQIQIVAYLEGHKILDTGLVNKSENFSYEIQEIS